MSRWRQLGAPGGVAIAAALLLVTGTVVARHRGVASIPSLPGLHAPDFSADANARLAPLRSDFVAERLGRGTVAGLLAGLRPTVVSARVAAPPAAIRVPVHAKRPPAPEAAPTAVNRGFLGDVLAPGAWDLRLGFGADRATVLPGHDILYTLTVRNVGRAAFNGRVELRSHVPFLTSHIADPVCAVETFLQMLTKPGNTCPLPGLPLPPGLQDLDVAGQPIPLTGLTWSTQTSIPAGGTFVRTFRVTVDPGADDQVIANHAHVSVLGSPAQRSDDVLVRVGRTTLPPTGLSTTPSSRR